MCRTHAFTIPYQEPRYCCGEVLNADQSICPFCDEPTRTLSDAAESYWTDVYSSEPPVSVDEAYRAAVREREGLRHAAQQARTGGAK